MSGRRGVMLVLGALAACDGDATSQRMRDYIRADRYTRLVIETDHIKGHATGSQERLRAPLAALLDKPDGIEVVSDSILPNQPGRAWALPDLDALMDEHDDYAVDERTIKMHTVVVDGHWHEDSEDGKVLGLSWGEGRIAIFTETIASVCKLGVPPRHHDVACIGTANAVWLHEIGHLLGLVGNGLAMRSAHADPDPAHGSHDANADCVMHWNIDRDAILERVRAWVAVNGDSIVDPELAQPFAFDAACQADIAALRE